jgi:hypothetical protein
MDSVLHLLVAYWNGDREAFDRLVPIVYDELCRIAARYLGRERAGHTLQPTALVNEVLPISRENALRRQSPVGCRSRMSAWSR